MNKIKLFFVFSLTLIATLSYAQTPAVVYYNYDGYEAKILHTLKESNGISTYPSMKKLKQQAQNVAENTLVPVNLIKGSNKPISGEKLVNDRSESVLLISRYSPKLVTDEGVMVGASAVVLSADGVCLTNYHVLQTLIDRFQKLTPLDSIFFVATKSGKIYPITSVLSYNRTADIALFKIDPHGDKLTVSPVGKDLVAGADINMFTHPEWNHFYFSKGVVARNSCTSELDPDTNRDDITADYAKGSSGGGAYDDCGNLVGIASTTRSVYYIDNPQTSLQMVVKSIIPISSIMRLIKNS